MKVGRGDGDGFSGWELWVNDVYTRRALAQGWGEVEEEGDLPEDEAQVHAVNRVPDSHDGRCVLLSVVVMGW